MKVVQLNKQNKGIDDMEFPGYQHHDGINLSEAIEHDMIAFAENPSNECFGEIINSDQIPTLERMCYR